VWAGEEAIERVEVSTDGGSRWSDAELAAKAAFCLETWAASLAAGESWLLHDPVTRDRFGGTTPAGRVALEYVGLPVQCDRSRGRESGEEIMKPTLLLLGGALAAGAPIHQSWRGEKEEARSCIATARIVHSQRLSEAASGREPDKMTGWGIKVEDRDALVEYSAAN
jgi:hypothetical protein